MARSRKSGAPGAAHTNQRFPHKCIAAMGIGFIGAIAFLCYHFSGVAQDGTLYLSELALVVTIITVFTGLFALAGVYLTHRSVDQAEAIRQRSVEQEREAELRRQQFEQEFEEKRGQLSDMIEEAQQYLASMRKGAAAFHPSGMFLAHRIRVLGVVQQQGQSSGGQTARRVRIRSAPSRHLLDGLAQAVEANAEFGAQVQGMFIGAREEQVEASALYLEGRAEELGAEVAAYAADVLRARIDLEEKMRRPSTRLIGSLSYRLRRIEDQIRP